MKLKDYTLEELETLPFDDIAYMILKEKGKKMKITDIFKTITIEPVKYGFPGKRRVVKCRCSILGIEQYVNFTIEKANGECYIADAEPAKG